MRIAIIGLGAVGTTLAYRLTRYGAHQVTAVARSKRLEQLTSAKGHITDASARKQPVKLAQVASALPVDEPFDVVLVTVLAHQLDEDLLNMLAASKAAKIMFMFNTVQPLSTYSDRVGASRFEFCFPIVMSLLDDQGELKHSIVTSGGGWPITSATFSAAFKEAGIKTYVEPRMQSWLRSHAIIIAPLMGMMQKAKRRDSRVFVTWADAKLASQALTEGRNLVRELHEDVTPGFIDFLANWPRLTTFVLWLLGKTSMMAETAKYSPREAQALIDSMASLASDGGKPSLRAMLSLRPV